MTADPLLQPLWVTVALAAFAAVSSIGAWLKARQVHQVQGETHDLVLKLEISMNSRMDALLASTKEAALLAGAALEKARAESEFAASKKHPEAEEEHSG